MAATDKVKRAWDTDTAAVTMALGAMLFLFSVRRGFRGVIVRAG